MSEGPSNYAARLRAASKLHAKGEYQKALEVLETIPEEPETLKAKAENLIMIGRTDEAIDCHRAIVKRHPRDPLPLIDLADLLTTLGQYKAAVKTYDKAIRLEPTVARFHRDRALALSLYGKDESALEGYDTALKLDADDGDTWAAKADLLIKLLRFPEAIECLAKASAAPARTLDAIGWISRGSSLDREGGYEEAIYCYDRALEQDPNEISAYTGKVSVLYRKGDLDSAIEICDYLIQVRPEDNYGWIEKGNIMIELRQYVEALKCFKSAIELKPDDPELWAINGYCYAVLGQYREALPNFAKAIDIDPNYAYPWESKAYCLYELKRFDEAESATRQTLKLNPKKAWTNNHMGLLVERRKKFEEALEWYDRASKIDPNTIFPAINKVRIQIKLKQVSVSEARTLYIKLLEKARDDEKAEAFAITAIDFSDQLKDARKSLELFEQAEAMGYTGPTQTLSIAEVLIRLDRHKEGRARASSVLKENAELSLRTVATFFVYASYALEGDLGMAERCFADFADSMVAIARTDDPTQSVIDWSYDGFLDTVINSPVSLATKFALAAAIDLHTGQLNAPCLSNLRNSFPLIKQPAI